jgi:LuxR family maltose regulon positive regulatory protein
LLRQTEGWVAGLQLAAISVQQGSSAADVVADFGGQERLIVDYLTSEVLARQTEDVQRFLLTTSILDRLSAPLCRQLVPDVEAQAMLELLDRGNLFLVPLDRKRRWYRYHHLFAELLRSRLRSTRLPEQVNELHRQASTWFEGQGLADEAIQHAVAAGDVEKAAEMMAALPISVLWEQGGAVLLSGWLRRIPEPVADKYPRVLSLAAGAFMLQGYASQALGILERLSRHESQAAEYGLLKAIVIRNEGEHERAREMILAIMPELERREPLLGMLARLQLAVISGDTGSLEEARTFSESVRFEASSGDPPLLAPWLQATQLEAIVRLAQGDLVEAEKLVRDAREEIVGESSITMPMVGLLDGVLGSIYYQWNELDRAERCFLEARKWYERSGISDLLFAAGFGMAELALARGDHEQVGRWIQELRAESDLWEMPAMQGTLASVEAVLQARMGRIGVATQWADASGLQLDDRPDYMRAQVYVRLAQVRLAEDESYGVAIDRDRLLALLHYLLELFDGAGHCLNVIDCHLMVASHHQLSGNTELALAALQKALDAARPGYVQRPFLERGLTMRHLLEEAGKRQISLRQVRRLLAAIAVEEGGSASTTAEPVTPVDSLAESLTERELEVLALLIEGLTNQDIAERLVISKNTVRTHIKNIYVKLNVRSRVEAAARSHELKLLPPSHPPRSM